MKGVGEVGSNGPLPAIAGVLADACGIHVNRAPLTAERVLDALAPSTGGFGTSKIACPFQKRYMCKGFGTGSIKFKG